MALADPLVIAARAPTPALNLAVTDTSKPYETSRRDAGTNGEYTATISHQISKSGAARHYIRVADTKVALSPITNVNSNVSAAIALSISVPPFGFTTAQITALYALHMDVIAAATLAKILNNES